MLQLLDAKLLQVISDTELELQSMVWHPDFIPMNMPNQKSQNNQCGPFVVTRLWYDFHDEVPTLGVTYEEASVKNGKKIDIFRPVRLGIPISVMAIWANTIGSLLRKLSDQPFSRIPKQYPADTSDKIRRSFEESLLNEQG